MSNNKMLGVDFGAIAIKGAGHAAGGLAIRQINRIPFIKNAKPAAKGLITALIGYVGAPIIIEKLGLAKKKGDVIAAFAGHAGDAIGFVGICQAINAVNPGIMPTITGIGEPGGVAGYERTPFIGGPELEVVETVAGTESEPVLEGAEEGNEF
jgi:hypothetical protein